MRNKDLAQDYIIRSLKRLKAVGTLMDEESYADVVRESQEVVELSLKGLLRAYDIEVPRIHDVSGILKEHKQNFPKKIQDSLKKLMSISKTLRRDRELAFYGSEDLTPSEFYEREDASEAQSMATWVVELIAGVMLKKSGS